MEHIEAPKATPIEKEWDRITREYLTIYGKARGLADADWIFPNGIITGGEGIHATEVLDILEIMGYTVPKNIDKYKALRIIRKKMPLIRIRGSGREIYVDTPEEITPEQFSSLSSELRGKSRVVYDIYTRQGAFKGYEILDIDKGRSPIELLDKLHIIKPSELKFYAS